jgi:hypothetical protein
VSYPTVAGTAVEGTPYREAQMCLGPVWANSYYLFFLSGTSTPTNIYQNGTLTTAFPAGNRVTSDAYGRFAPIYLDPSIIYRVQFFNSAGVRQWQVDPYTSQLSTVGTSSLSPYGFQIAPTGEFTLDAPNTGGTGITLTLKAGVLGSAALRVTGTLAGNSAIIINNSATTGAQTATFAATNKPGTAASSPAGWLPITCDGVQYYTPIWHGNNFTPYVANPTALGEVINASTVTFTGTGLTTVTGGTATPSNWFSPTAAGIGAGYYINITKTGGLSGLAFVEVAPTTATVAPAGATYTGGTLSANYNGNTASNYTVILSTGQTISGCTFTNGSATFTTPSTNITGTPSTIITVTPQGVWANITTGGLTISSNAAAPITGTYQLSTSVSGSPIVATGTITLSNNNGVQSPTYNGVTPIVYAGNGTATVNGVASSNWYAPTTASIGASYYLLITQTGGTSGYSFSTATGTPVNITSGGLSIGITGTGTPTNFVTGTYQISSDSAGANVLGSGTITLNGSPIQSPTWNGTTPLFLAANGTATLNGVSTSNWYSPTTSNVGSGYYINITRTGGTTGVSFATALGSWTNITNSGLSIGLSGTSGNVGTVNAVGTWSISSSNTGSPVLGTGSITLSQSGLTVVHVYATAGTTTETIPSGSTTMTIELFGACGGGGGGGGGGNSGGCGGGGGYARSAYTVTGHTGQNVSYTLAAAGTGGVGSTGAGLGGAAGGTPSASTASTGSFTITTMTANGGGGGGAGGPLGSQHGTGGTGSSASGGNVANTSGSAGSNGDNSGGFNGTVGTTATGVNYAYTGDGGMYGLGYFMGAGSLTNGSPGNPGAIVFYYQ